MNGGPAGASKDETGLCDSFPISPAMARPVTSDVRSATRRVYPPGGDSKGIRLERRGIPYHYEEFDDGHRDVQYRYDVSLRAISQAWGK